MTKTALNGANVEDAKITSPVPDIVHNPIEMNLKLERLREPA